MRNRFVNALLNIAETYDDIYLLTGDLGYNVIAPFIEKYPERYINVGIAEQNMTGVAAGIAMMGKTVFTYSIANFPSLRCLEQIRNDVAYHNANVKIVSVGAGFGYGQLGMSHHATEDVAIMRSLPNMVVCSPGDPIETELCTKLLYEYKGPCYLRLGKGGEKSFLPKAMNIKIGDSIMLKEGTKIAILSSGPILEEAFNAWEELNRIGLSTGLYSFPFVKPIDEYQIEKCATDYDIIVTVEEHNKLGGFSSAVSEVICKMRTRKAYQITIALDDCYTSTVGNQKYLRKEYKLDSDSIVKLVLAAFHNN